MMRKSPFSLAPRSAMAHGEAVVHDIGGSMTLRFARQAKSSAYLRSNIPVIWGMSDYSTQGSLLVVTITLFRVQQGPFLPLTSKAVV